MNNRKLRLGMLLGLGIFLLMQPAAVRAQNYLQEIYSPKKKARLKAWPGQIIKQLAIGDTIPDLRLKNLSNYPLKSVKLSEFNKKLLVLDFWGINCSGCIGAFPKMESLQAKYNDQIQILLVTRDDQEDVDYRKSFSPLVRNTTLPMLNHDTVLTRYFYYRSVPAHVWIDSNLVVREITNGWNTTAENIEKYLNGEELKFGEKTAFIGLDFDKPIWMEADGRYMDELQSYSYFMGNIEGTSDQNPKRVLYDTVAQKPIGVYIVNQPIKMIYLFALQDKRDKEWYNLLYRENRTLYELDNPSRLIPPKNKADYDEWRAKNHYCYELKVPLAHSDSVFSIMRQDLERFFRIEATIETRKVKALVLQKMDGWPEKANIPLPDTIILGDGSIRKVESGHRPSLDPAKDLLYFKNWEFQKVVKWLQGKFRFYPFPLADQWESDSTIVNIVLRRGDPENPKSNSALLKYEVLKADLEKYGLKMVEEEREMKMLVFKDI